MSGIEENKLFAQRFYDDFYNRGRLALAEELVAANFIDHTAPVGTPIGPAGVRTTLTRLQRKFWEYRYVIEDLIAEGDRVVALLTFTGTLGEGQPAGRRVVRPEIHVLRVVDGKGAECWCLKHAASPFK
jgi:predicted ester cyclase